MSSRTDREFLPLIILTVVVVLVGAVAIASLVAQGVIMAKDMGWWP